MRSFPFRRRNGKLGVSVTHDNPGTRGWASLVHDAAVERAPATPLEGALSVRLEFSLPRPRSVSEKGRPLPTVRPDLDKLVRLVFDACKGIIWRDDAQVVELEAVKMYGLTPGVAVRIDNQGEGTCQASKS